MSVSQAKERKSPAKVNHLGAQPKSISRSMHRGVSASLMQSAHRERMPPRRAHLSRSACANVPMAVHVQVRTTTQGSTTRHACSQGCVRPRQHAPGVAHAHMRAGPGAHTPRCGHQCTRMLRHARCMHSAHAQRCACLCMHRMQHALAQACGPRHACTPW